MYLCSTCGSEYPFLIFEYNTVVCEKCSIRKNISNCSDFDGTVNDQEELESGGDDDKELICVEDTKQLFAALDQIENPRIRAYFKIVAQQYFGEGLI